MHKIAIICAKYRLKREKSMSYKSNSKFFVLDNIIELGREVWRKTTKVEIMEIIGIITKIDTKYASKDTI